MIAHIITDPDPRLLQVSRRVTSEPVAGLLVDMIETMRHGNGIGLAAIQIGVPLRVIVMEPKPGELWQMVNPEVTRFGGAMKTRDEGCLSVPGRTIRVTRPDHIRVRFINEHGKAGKVFAQGWFATCIQHELDHLNGVLISSAETTEGANT